MREPRIGSAEELPFLAKFAYGFGSVNNWKSLLAYIGGCFFFLFYSQILALGVFLASLRDAYPTEFLCSDYTCNYADHMAH